MHELNPGLWHWNARRESIHSMVSSYYLLEQRVIIDPMIPPEGLEWFTVHDAPPEHALLSNRHHDRDAWRLREEFGTVVHCPRNGIHELDGRGPVEPFDFGAMLPGGVLAIEIGAICPDETALHIPDHAALACADGLVRMPDFDGPLGFVPDSLMDDPPATRAGLIAAYERVLELDFDLLLLPHGNPLEQAKPTLREFLAAAK